MVRSLIPCLVVSALALALLVGILVTGTDQLWPYLVMAALWCLAIAAATRPAWPSQVDRRVG